MCVCVGGCVSMPLLYVDNWGMCLYNLILNTFFCNFMTQLKSWTLCWDADLFWLSYFKKSFISTQNKKIQTKPRDINLLNSPTNCSVTYLNTLGSIMKSVSSWSSPERWRARYVGLFSSTAKRDCQRKNKGTCVSSEDTHQRLPVWAKLECGAQHTQVREISSFLYLFFKVVDKKRKENSTLKSSEWVDALRWQTYV